MTRRKSLDDGIDRSADRPRPARRARLIGQIRDCGKEVVCTAHLYPFSSMTLGATALQEREISRLFFKDQIDVAVTIGAAGFVFSSGVDVSE